MKRSDDMPEKEAKTVSLDFYIKIMFCQNASWQGEIHWLEGDQKRYFRSYLELTMLMQAALLEAGLPQADYTWKKK